MDQVSGLEDRRGGSSVVLPTPPCTTWVDSFPIFLLHLFVSCEICLRFGLNFPWSTFIPLLQILSPWSTLSKPPPSCYSELDDSRVLWPVPHRLAPSGPLISLMPCPSLSPSGLRNQTLCPFSGLGSLICIPSSLLTSCQQGETNPIDASAFPNKPVQ